MNLWKKFVTLLTGNKGRIVSATAAVVTATATGVLSKYVGGAADQVATQIGTFTGALVGWILDAAAARTSSNAVTEMQQQLKTVLPSIQVDGHAGPQTKAAVEALVESTKTIAAEIAAPGATSVAVIENALPVGISSDTSAP